MVGVEPVFLKSGQAAYSGVFFGGVRTGLMRSHTGKRAAVLFVHKQLCLGRRKVKLPGVRTSEHLELCTRRGHEKDNTEAKSLFVYKLLPLVFLRQMHTACTQ